MKSDGIICRAATDQCDQSERCDGVIGTCPPATTTPIYIQDGQASITLADFATPTAFQPSTDKLHLKLNGFSLTCGSLTVKWSLIKDDDKCNLDKNNATLLSNTKNHILIGLNLQDAETYKVVVQISDIRKQSGLSVCSNPVTIDTSTPTSGWVHDGIGPTDLQYQSSRSFSASWGGFQSIYGIGKYEVAMEYKPLSSSDKVQVQDFMDVNLNVSFSKTIAVIPDGSNLTTKVRAYTKAGLYTEIASNGVTVDTSEPLSGSVADGSNLLSDLEYADWTNSFTVSWEPFTDPHTPIIKYSVGVKRKNGGFVSSGLYIVGLKQNFVVLGLVLASGEEYCAIVEGENAAGLKTFAHSNCLLVDHDAPQHGTVRDGSFDDIDYQSSDTVFHANWNGFDDGVRGSGLAEYKYTLTDQNDINIKSWTSVSLRTNVTLDGLSLVDGNTYYITVRAIDRVGNYKDIKSDGVYIDATHPVYTGKVIVEGETAQENNELVVYVQHKEPITASWPQFVDAHSGMKKYQWSIVKNQEQPTKWQDMPGTSLATRATFRTLSLVNNTEYRLIIRGINNAGLHTDITSPVIIPVSANTGLGIIFDGNDPLMDIDYQTNISEVHATWQGFETADVKVRAYFFAIGSCMRGNYHVTNNQFMPVTPPTATSFGIQGLRLGNGQRYCFKIKAENLAGVKSREVSSDGFLVDVTAPDMRRAMILDGQGEDDIDHQFETTELSATWNGIQDHESGIQHYEVAVSRSRGDQSDVTSFIDVSHNRSATITGLHLNNEVYYIVLCAINNAGLRSCLASDGILIDPTSPTSGIVNDGILEPDIRYQATTDKLSANWERIWDLESRVERFEWGIGEDKENLVQEFVDVGLQTHVTSKTTLHLKHGHNYTVFLRVYNRAGVLQELSSDGVIIDTTPPVPREIKPRVSPPEWHFSDETETYYSSSPSGIDVTWQNFEERESEMWYYKWAIGTSKNGTQFQPFINVGLLTNANTSGSGLIIRPGVRYFVTVMGRNRAGLVSSNCSWPFLIDYTPPRTGNIEIQSYSGVKKDYFTSDENMRVRWSGFEDSESGIENYEVSVLNNNGETLNYTWKSTHVKLQVLINTILLPPGKTYSIVVKSINYAGLESSVISAPFTVDDTPPVYTGNENRLPKRYFQSDPNLLEVVWEDFKDHESPVEFYEIGMGRQVSGDDVYKFTRTGLCKKFRFSHLDITDNQPYYVTLNAYNMAGLVTSLLLEEVTFDQSPPTGNNESVKDGLSDKDIDHMSLESKISAALESIEDAESGINKIECCVGTTPFNCFVKPFTSIHKNKSFVCTDCKINAEMTAFATFRVTNGAGLFAIFVSDGVTFDSTPPEIQSIYDGTKAEYPDVEKTYSNWTPTITWYGARDIQSGLRNCQWRIVKKERNTTVYVKTLHKANITYNIRHIEKADTIKLTTDSTYFNVIECWNHAGLISHQYSNGWSIVEQWPIPSYVIDGPGPHDMKYDVNGETLKASWGKFHADSKDPVIKYEWAVGTFPEIDNILEFTDVGLNTKVSLSLIESDAIIRPGVEYYTTVRATTLSGWISNKTSNGFIVDKTSPTAGIVNISHEILNQNTNDVDYTISWEGFADSETGINNYAYCLGYINNVCSTTLYNAGLAFQGRVRGFLPEAQDMSLYGIVIATNKAGLITEVSSNPVKIDFTPPVTGTVLDGVDVDLDYISSNDTLATTWSAFTDHESGIKTCTLSVNEENPARNKSISLKSRIVVNSNGSITHNISLISGLRYVSTLTCENFDGFKSSKSSNGVIVDDSPPIVGKIIDKNQYVSFTNELHVRWTDGYDFESGIREYLVAVGSGSNEDDVLEYFSVGLARQIKIKNITMNPGSTYFITLQIVNKAGMASRVSSSGIIVDTSLPKIHEVKIEGSKTGYIGPEVILRGNWKALDDESDIDFTEFCFGTTKEGCNVQDMHRTLGNEVNATCLGCKLEHKYTYFMTVRVWNKAGLFNLATSEGVTADLTAPVGGRVSLNRTHMSCVGGCGLMAEFSGFMDEETGVKRCEFSIKTINDVTVNPVEPTTSENQIEVNQISLDHGKSYKIAVACYNGVGERSELIFSPPLRIDNTPPEKGFVIISPDENHDVRRQHVGCHFFNTTLRVFWSEFQDEESNIAEYRVAIGRRQLGYDIIPYTHFGIVSDATFDLREKYGLSLGETIFATVKAVNKAGLSTEVSSPPTRLISSTDLNLAQEDFLCINV